MILKMYRQPKKQRRKDSPEKKARREAERQKKEEEFKANIERIRCDIIANEKTTNECRQNNRFIYRNDILFGVMDYLPLQTVMQWIACNKRMHNQFCVSETGQNYLSIRREKIILMQNMEKFCYCDYEIDELSDNIKNIKTAIDDFLPRAKKLECSFIDFLNFTDIDMAARLIYLYSVVKRNWNNFQCHLSYQFIGWQPLVLAVRANRPDAIEMIINNDPDVNTIGHYDVMLHLAMESNDSCLLAHVLRHGEKIVTPENIKLWKRFLIKTTGKMFLCYEKDKVDNSMIDVMFLILKSVFAKKENRILMGVSYSINSCKTIKLLMAHIDVASMEYWESFLSIALWTATRNDNLEMIDFLFGLQKGNLKYSDLKSFVTKDKIVEIFLNHLILPENLDKNNTKICVQLCKQSDKTRKFLRDKNVDPTFDNCRLLWVAIGALDVATVEYCLTSKSIEMDYFLAINDVFNHIGDILRFDYALKELDEERLSKCVTIVKLLLDDDRTCPHLDSNNFFKRAIDAKFIKLVEVLIDSGKVFFPYYLVNFNDFRCNSEMIAYFASHKTYYPQIVECYDYQDSLISITGSFCDKIIQKHDSVLLS